MYNSLVDGSLSNTARHMPRSSTIRIGLVMMNDLASHLENQCTGLNIIDVYIPCVLLADSTLVLASSPVLPQQELGIVYRFSVCVLTYNSSWCTIRAGQRLVTIYSESVHQEKKSSCRLRTRCTQRLSFTRNLHPDKGITDACKKSRMYQCME